MALDDHSFFDFSIPLQATSPDRVFVYHPWPHSQHRPNLAATDTSVSFYCYSLLFGVSDSTRSTIRLASATASAIAATYAGEFLPTVANFLAARIDAHTAMTADLRGSSTKARLAYSPFIRYRSCRDVLAGLYHGLSIRNCYDTKSKRDGVRGYSWPMLMSTIALAVKRS